MYGLKYRCEFDPISSSFPSSPVYVIEIYQKGYSGEVFKITGSTIPVVHQWETDDPKAPIKGSSLTMNFINDGTLPMTSFLSTDDDEFLVTLFFNQFYFFKDTANISVVPGIEGQTKITINELLSDQVIDEAINIVINGTTYDIVSISKDSTNTYITTFGTPVMDAETAFTINYGSTKTLFTGFVVQDDCSEDLLDFNHEITLSANDNLGLLKNVTLDQANIFSVSFTSTDGFIQSDFVGRTFTLQGFTPFPSFNIGDKISITGQPGNTGTNIDAQYTINNIVVGSGILYLTVDEPIPATSFGVFIYQRLIPQNLLDKTPLSSILNMCLSQTSLQLPVNFYTKIMEITQDASKSFFEQTLINPQSFLTSSTGTDYMNCYDILTAILSRFNMSLFQAEGVWNIVRWDELRYFNNQIQGYSYDSNINYIGAITKAPVITTGPGESIYPQTGILQQINRPFLFDKETFNYNYPPLIRNADFMQLGSFIKTYRINVWIKDQVVYITNPGGSGVVATFQTVNEYNATWWTKDGLPSDFEPGNYFIRVTLDDIGNELSRIMVVNGYCRSYPIEVAAGDSFNISFSFKTQDSQDGTVGLVFILELTDGTQLKYFHNPDLTNGTGMWQTGTGFVYQVLEGDNTNQWHTVTINCQYFPIPFDGLLRLYLTVADLKNPINETYYKDISMTYTAQINESVLIDGQTHLQTQTGVIKNTEDLDISIDDSPRNLISGTLFLNQLIGIIQQRTNRWQHPYISNQSKRLGDLITWEQMFWRNKPRSILEGTLYNVIQISNFISLLSILKYNQLSTLNFAWGQLEIDYKNNTAQGTLYEIWEDKERDTDVAFGYAFNYLYSLIYPE